MGKDIGIYCLRYLLTFKSFFREKLVNYFQSLDSKTEYFAKRRCEEIPFQLLQSGKLQELANFLVEGSNFKLMLGEDMKIDLYKYWREASQRVPHIEVLLLEGLRKFTQGSKPSLVAEFELQVGEFLQDIAAYNSAGECLLIGYI